MINGGVHFCMFIWAVCSFGWVKAKVGEVEIRTSGWCQMLVDFLGLMYYNWFVVDPFKSLGRWDFDLIICTRSFKSTHDFVPFYFKVHPTTDHQLYRYWDWVWDDKDLFMLGPKMNLKKLFIKLERCTHLCFDFKITSQNYFWNHLESIWNLIFIPFFSHYFSRRDIGGHLK